MHTTHRLSAVVGLCLVPALACAQPEGGAGEPAPVPTPEAVAQAPDRVSFELSLSPSHSVSSDFDDVGGEVGVTRVGGRLGASILFPPKSQLSLSFGTEHSWYEFDGPVTLVAGTAEPFEHVTHYDVGATFSTQLSDAWSVIVGATIESGAEDGADFGESLTYGGVVGARYKVNDSLTLGLAVAVSSRLEDDARVLPLPLIEWRIDDRWRLGSWALGHERGGYALTYKASDELTLGVGGAYHVREFRLDEDGPVPDGVGRDVRIPVGFILAWTPNPRAEVRGFAGADFGTEFEVLNASGGSIGEDQTDPSLSFGVSARFRF